MARISPGPRHAPLDQSSKADRSHSAPGAHSGLSASMSSRRSAKVRIESRTVSTCDFIPSMIVRDDGLGVSQTAHSALAGQLASAWIIAEDLPRSDLVTAAYVHDIGWTEWEQDPPWPDPPPFYALAAAEHAAIWTKGTDEAATFGRWVGLLVSLHCTRLMGWRIEAGNSSPEVDALVEREQARQRELRDGLDDGVIERASELIATWDGLSLKLCGGEVPVLDPWPFARDVVELHVDARRLAGRS